ncbi:PREDICTED: squalene epoxidase 5-like [Tarenaya hassleriana]|uniref:squalene epoxidase 5-like n=1 Tax=Tarenaya hassleriana TaxID=28532 RepID=UPI00053C5E95|nr:PREDICTED: squalene epoxidase 5-like [Tarenaya hassleriana]
MMILGERVTALSPYVWPLTLVAVVLTWTAFNVDKKKKKKRQNNKAAATAGSRRSDTDVIIVGAGVAGSALAYALAKDGRRVHVIERDLREPERLMGEGMQPGGRLMLAKLGLHDCLEGIESQTTIGMVLYKDGKCVTADFPADDKFPHEPYARSLRNGRFVQRLRHKAASLPNVNLEEGTVKSLVEEGGVVKGVKYKSKVTGQETSAFAPLTVVCDGAYSNLRRSIHNSKEELHSHIVGFTTKNCRLEDPERFNMVMTKPNVTLIYQLSDNEVRCYVEVPRESVANGEITTFLKTTLAPQLPPKLRDIFSKGLDDAPKILKTATKSMTTPQYNDYKGVVVLGDAFNMRHPIIASGMMVALSDTLILRDLLRSSDNLSDAKKLSQVVKSFYEHRKPMSATVNTLADAFRQVLRASDDEAREAMRQGFFDYISRGGICTSGVMAIFGGMNPRPISLLLHLFAVTLSCIARFLSPFPTPRGIWLSLRLFWLALGMLGPNLKKEGVWHMLSPTAAAAYRKRYMTATATAVAF